MEIENNTNHIDVRERILTAARDLFITKGYTGTSVRDIATAADANVAHIKYYFGSKRGLLEVIFDEAFDLLLNRIVETLSSEMPFFELIEEWINIYYEILPEQPHIPLFAMNEIVQGPDSLAAKVRERKPHLILARLEERMNEEVKKGTIKDIPVANLGLTILSVCVFPFIFKVPAAKVIGESEAELNKMLKEHKEFVLNFVFSGLKP